MSRNRRDRRSSNRLVVHITARVFEGLPFIPRRTVTRILKGIIARGQFLFPVTICAFTIMGNHHHFILAGNGNRISPFMNFVQGEIAKAFKRLAPAKYRDKFWSERFHEQRLLTEDDVIEKIIYTYLNPVEAGLVKTADEYSPLSSINAFKLGTPTEELCNYIPSRCLNALHNTYSSKKDVEEDMYLVKNIESFPTLRIEPMAWLKCFGLENRYREMQGKLMSIFLEQSRKASKQQVLGMLRLTAQPLSKAYRPDKKERTPYIICYEKQLRKIAIQSYREFNRICRDAWRALKLGIVQILWPIGAYKPYHSWGPWRA